ncbi:hypothetical protein [Scandinavium goeteborgense]|uniref:Type I restriction modification DNA specificity protein n=1 Tax=Scandinavium goeteborgense TaxID=1851514 RepID=A0A4R6DSK0_SCAGO|nr:hypothetical protein [Scandinavium goeteborgense]TDN48056.1 hypothetical protein EC847_1286 [Scandinavium goeteborgense]
MILKVTMRLQDVATVATNFPDADFWIVRRGSVNTVGEPSWTFNPEHIGVKVVRTDLILSRYLYYCFMHLHSAGKWKPLATGSLELVNIRVSDIKHIALIPR